MSCAAASSASRPKPSSSHRYHTVCTDAHHVLSACRPLQPRPLPHRPHPPRFTRQHVLIRDPSSFQTLVSDSDRFRTHIDLKNPHIIAFPPSFEVSCFTHVNQPFPDPHSPSPASRCSSTWPATTLHSPALRTARRASPQPQWSPDSSRGSSRSSRLAIYDVSPKIRKVRDYFCVQRELCYFQSVGRCFVAMV